MSRKKAVLTSPTIFPEEKSDISTDTSNTIGSILESYNQRGQQFSVEGIDYTPITLITTISNLYLIKKYKTNCFMYGDKAKDESFVYGGFIFNFLEGQLDLPMAQIQNDILLQINGKNLFQIHNFLNCVKNGQPIIIIPLLFIFSDGSNHANMLIYRRELNIIEHFEPHGSFFDLNPKYGEKITQILQLLLTKINELNSSILFKDFLPGNIRLIPSNEVCIHHRGLQAIQTQLASFSIEGSGYCQMWSLLFAELALLNPTMNSRDILNEIYRLLETQEGAVFLSNVIRGYVSMLGDEISSYLSEYINNAFTIENISYICRILFPYASYLSKILTFIVWNEVNIDSFFAQMPKTKAQLEATEQTLQVKLSEHFRLQNELKELLINRKLNYSVRGKESVDAEIIAKLREDFNYNYYKNKDIQNYIQNKIFQKYVALKQSTPAVAEKKATKKGTKKGGKKYKKRKISKTKKYKRNKRYSSNKHLKF
jgi:hypothetical protein